MSKHTPGPWRLIVGAEGYYSVVSECKNLKDEDRIICDNTEYYPKEATKENARLIAAAPELLEALKAIVYGLCKEDEEGLIEHTEQITNARKAIAEAEGSNE